MGMRMSVIMDALTLGISSCLLGEKVRWDGGHRLDRLLTETLGRFFVYVSVCPEVECGYPVPREPFHLEGEPAKPRLINSMTGEDHTDRMKRWAKKRVRELEDKNLSGFIFKSGSPSSGMEQVKVRNEKGKQVRKGQGIFARIFIEHFPLLPVEGDERLHDPRVRENFIERIFTMGRWRTMLRERGHLGGLVEFHARHKMQILSHQPRIYREMEKLVSEGRGCRLRELFGLYQELLVKAMGCVATAEKNADVLRYATGYLKKDLSLDEAQELLEAVDGYQLGASPLIVPVTLINHYARKYEKSFLKDQFYLHPHPVELQLR